MKIVVGDSELDQKVRQASEAMKRPHIFPVPYSLCFYASHSLTNSVLFPGVGIGDPFVGEQRAEAARG